MKVIDSILVLILLLLMCNTQASWLLNLGLVRLS